MYRPVTCFMTCDFIRRLLCWHSKCDHMRWDGYCFSLENFHCPCDVHVSVWEIFFSFTHEWLYCDVRSGHDNELPLQRACHHQLPFWEGPTVTTLQRRTCTAQVSMTTHWQVSGLFVMTDFFVCVENTVRKIRIRHVSVSIIITSSCNYSNETETRLWFSLIKLWLLFPSSGSNCLSPLQIFWIIVLLTGSMCVSPSSSWWMTDSSQELVVLTQFILSAFCLFWPQTSLNVVKQASTWHFFSNGVFMSQWSADQWCFEGLERSLPLSIMRCFLCDLVTSVLFSCNLRCVIL